MPKSRARKKKEGPPRVIVVVAARAGQTTYVSFVTRSLALGRQIQGLLNVLGAEGNFDPTRTYIIFGHDGINTNVMIALPADVDWEPLTALFTRECRQRLSVRVGRINDTSDYDGAALYARKARAQDN